MDPVLKHFQKENKTISTSLVNLLIELHKKISFHLYNASVHLSQPIVIRYLQRLAHRPFCFVFGVRKFLVLFVFSCKHN